jgi:T5SS/PEP-CTERM-associated repeat protein
LNVGGSGTGTLNIQNGGQVFDSSVGVNGFSSTATVDGIGSKWTNSGGMVVGTSSTGALNIRSGGLVSNKDGYLGFFKGARGTATVDGANSKWTQSGELNVGRSGTGILWIQNGGHVSNTYGYLGYNSGSSGTATVVGTGSQWTNSAYLYVGNSGAGELNIQNGGQVSNTYGFLGSDSGSSGTVTVDGSGSLWNNTGSLYVGGSSTSAGGTGSVTVQNGGQLIVGETLKLWKADSTVTVSGGTLTAATIANYGALTVQSGGDLTVTGDLANSGILTVNDAMLTAATITNTGTIRGRGDINGTITNNAGGVVMPGASPGILEVDDITFADASTLQIELGGLARGTQYDVLAASGTLTMQTGSTLAVTLINGFVPQGNDEFDIMDFGGRSGEFTNVSLPALGGGLSWDTSGLYTSGTITVAPEPATLALVAMGAVAMFVRRRLTCLPHIATL